MGEVVCIHEFHLQQGLQFLRCVEIKALHGSDDNTNMKGKGSKEADKAHGRLQSTREGFRDHLPVVFDLVGGDYSTSLR
ncbi:MAG: hypothetical protein R6Y91_01415 [Desulfohalobium sp.]